MSVKDQNNILLFESFEDRLVRLEDERVDIATWMGEQTSTLKQISKEINSLSETSKETNKNLAEIVKDFQVSIINTNNTLKNINDRVDAKGETLKIWHKWWGKVLYGTLAAGGAVLLKLFIEN